MIKNLSKRAMLVVLDGFGIREATLKNAINDAATPNLDYLFNNFPYTTIQGSGLPVGLPDGIIGNSEVGHMNIGAGRRVTQDLVRINESIENGSFFKLDLLKELEKFKRIHIMGLISDGGVHSHIDHIFAIIKYFANKSNKLFLHCFMDGRDTPRDSGVNYLKQFVGKITIASIMGRFYAMDRDKRFDRIEFAYQTMTGSNVQDTDPINYLKEEYKKGIYDEFITPVLLNKDYAITNDDAAFFINYRPDRAIELVEAFNLESFSNFKREIKPKFFLRMTPNSEKVDLPILFNKEFLHNGLSEHLSNLGKKQLKIAETEKYAHVTFFFNGGRKEAFPNEEQILIPSPRDVLTYDLKPEMSAYLVLEKLLEELDNPKYDLFVCNFANPDMVGHTGNYLAAIKAIKTIDICIGKLIEKAKANNIALILTSDHGNSDQMIYPDSLPHTSHTGSPTPFVVFHPSLYKKGYELNGNYFALKDIAPTLLYIMGIEPPKEFTGKPVFK